MKRFLGFISIILTLIFYACGSGGGGSDPVTASGSDSSGTLRISVTDAPFPFQYVKSASVVIREVWVRHADGGGFEEQMLLPPVEIDLMPLTGGVAEAIVVADIPIGSYDQARLIVDAGTVVLSDNAHVSNGYTFNTELGNMSFPSATKNGIKVNIDPPVNVVTELSSDLTLDFDLTKSFVFNGPPTHAPGVKRVKFKPVIKAINDSKNGRITVRVLRDNGTPSDSSDDTALAGVTVTALDQTGAEKSSVTATNASGVAWLQLLPDIYDIRIEADEHETVMLEDITVFVANETSIGDVTLAMTQGQISGVVIGDSGTPDDANDDLVLEGVTVTLFEPAGIQPVAVDYPGQNPVQTDAQGVYKFDGLIPGDHDLKFEKKGFHSQMLTSVKAGPSGFAPTIMLAQTDGRIMITLMSDNGTPGTCSNSPVSGAKVKLFDEFGALQGTWTTNEAGFAEIMILNGVYFVLIEAERHSPLKIEAVEVIAGKVTVLGNVIMNFFAYPVP